jgi:hypothetical protein
LNCVSSEQDIHLNQTQTHSTERLIERDQIETVDYKAHDGILKEEIEQEVEEVEEVETPKSANLKKSPPSREEEAEMRKTVQVLFELEESLLDQHITNIKVSRQFFFVFPHF